MAAGTGGCVFVLQFLLILCYTGVDRASSQRSFTIDKPNNTFLKDGKPFRYIAGSIHYSRVPYYYWKDRLTKMAAGGLNAIQTYVTWNTHNPEPNVFDFTGQNDLITFLKTAQDAGLLVVLRAGPYICGEWEYGGFPAWIIRRNASIVTRSMDPQYIGPVTEWWNILLPKLKPMLYNNGGPVIMVQAENEYGSYVACDFNYLHYLHQLLRQHLGNDVVLFTVDGDRIGDLRCGTIPEFYATIDFGPGNATAAFISQRHKEPKGPLVNSEYYTGWLDHWGSPHSHTATQTVVDTLDAMLKMGANVNMYMYEGGTNFAYWNGADYPDYQPVTTSYDYGSPLTESGDVTEKYMAIRHTIAQGANYPAYAPVPTSYDYDGPLTEAGDITDKYMAIRDVIRKYEDLPPLVTPANTEKYAYGTVNLELLSPVQDLLSKLSPSPSPVSSKYPLSMEEVNQNYGFILYRYVIQANFSQQVLQVDGVRDRGYVMIDRVPQGVLVRESMTKLTVSGMKGQTLDILVENQGRINYGSGINNNRKGIIQNVTLNNQILANWQMYPLNFTNLVESLTDMIANHRPTEPKFNNVQESMYITPSVFYGFFKGPQNQTQPLDTYLRMDMWFKGQAFVNGFNLGRYWPVKGPQITLYVPSGVLKPYPAQNQVVMFELEYAPCTDTFTNSVIDYCNVEFVDTPVINATMVEMEKLGFGKDGFDWHKEH